MKRSFLRIATKIKLQQTSNITMVLITNIWTFLYCCLIRGGDHFPSTLCPSQITNYAISSTTFWTVCTTSGTLVARGIFCYWFLKFGIPSEKQLSDQFKARIKKFKGVVLLDKTTCQDSSTLGEFRGIIL